MYRLRTFICMILYHSINTHYIMYHSNTISSSYDCLYAIWDMDGKLITLAPYVHNYYLIPYCRRPDHNEEEEEERDFIDETMGKIINSKEFKQENITGNDLLNWSFPIDIAEEYEMKNESILYNCSLPWFGRKCQYKFPYDLSITFSEIVNETFTGRSSEQSISTGTCYRFIENCQGKSWPFCLDWREICDQKIDCLNGQDEEFCEELELNQCNENEYRCHNGQCIPLEFAWESASSLDCLDGSDEREIYSYHPNGSPPSYGSDCINFPIFRCEERTARYPHHFVCGDGQYSFGLHIYRHDRKCENNRDEEISQQLFRSVFDIEETDCRQAFYCALQIKERRTILDLNDPSIQILNSTDCQPLEKKCSLKWLPLPKQATMLGLFQLIYFTNRSINEFKENVHPDLICFNIKTCPILQDRVINIEIIDGLNCVPMSNLTISYYMNSLSRLIETLYSIIGECLTKGTEDFCPHSWQFHCNESRKCISYHRVGDGHVDCHFKEDEIFPDCSLNDSRRYQCHHPNIKCLSPVAIGNGFRNCFIIGDDEHIFHKGDFNKTQLYSKLCFAVGAQIGQHNRYTENIHCELWPCDNPYVHCDKIWDCQNGIDELNCSYSNCSWNEHECYDDQSKLFRCLSINQIVEEIDDCTSTGNGRILYFNNGSIINEKKYYSWNKTKCLHEKYICQNAPIPSLIDNEDVCSYKLDIRMLNHLHPILLFGTNKGLCYLDIDISRDRKESFLTALRLGYFPLVSSSSSIEHISITKKEKKKIYNSINIFETWYCNRGILILSGRNQTKTCLCPPSYFGAQCQWQNQRISLTLQFISPRTIFISAIFHVIIMLINEQDEIISNHEEILFAPTRDCRTKFHFYLLYPQRPKSMSTNYSIRIDLFNKFALNHWTSWYLSIPFPFLPVNRISTQLFIPKQQSIRSCPLLCGLHGQCKHYTNNEFKYFCLCNQGYSGRFCNESYQCQCSKNSFCLTSNICICPLDQFGSKCYLKRTICSLINNPCQNQGLCIPTDDRIDLQGYSCHCKEQYFGLHCEYFSSQIHLKLDQTILETSSFVFIHFITIFQYVEYERTTIVKKIPFHSNIITFYISKQFNLIFLQLSNQSYYLAIVRERFIPLENIHGEILSKQFCPYVKLFLNSTFLEYEQIHHPKFYSFLCRQNLHFMCFYDENLMCVCDLDRFANCFTFNHTIDNTCQKHNDCENDGQCFQNNQTCPTMSICACKNCYYGAKCQMSSEGNLLSLDPIIGYYIQPNLSFYHQPSIIKTTMSITLAIFILGFIDVLLSILTFHMKDPREVGCGYYLLASSIISLCMIIMLGMKFIYLILSQMKVIKDEFQLLVACKSIDVLLKSFLASNEWIIACVAMERVINTMSGPTFNKMKSKRLAKWMIPIVFTLTFLSHLHDPYYRELINDIDEDDQRIWCFVRYPSIVHTYNYFITLMHFLGPFILNTISALLIIVYVSRSRLNVQRDKSYHQHLREQFKRHKHLLISPLALVLLGTPRLVFSFVSGCMRTPRDSWLYVLGYYVSFIPPILTFSAFVLPSDNYKKAFRNAIQQQIIRFRSTFLSKF